MHEGLYACEHVCLLLAVIYSRQHGKAVAIFQGVFKDRHRDIAEHAVEHKQVADAAYTLSGKAPNTGSKGSQDWIDIIINEVFTLPLYSGKVKDAKWPKLLIQTPFHTVCPRLYPLVARQVVESGDRLSIS
jgi:hypothetical protein